MNKPKLTEEEVRSLRDRVFRTAISDNEWQTCRAHWMRPSEIAWLIAHDFPIRENLWRPQKEKVC